MCSFSSLICIRRNLNNFPINIYTLLNTDTRIAHTIVLCACLSILTCHGSLHIYSQFYFCLHFGKHYYWRWLWYRFVRYAYLHVWRILKFSYSISLLFIPHLMCVHTVCIRTDKKCSFIKQSKCKSSIFGNLFIVQVGKLKSDWRWILHKFFFLLENKKKYEAPLQSYHSEQSVNTAAHNAYSNNSQ